MYAPNSMIPLREVTLKETENTHLDLLHEIFSNFWQKVVTHTYTISGNRIHMRLEGGIFVSKYWARLEYYLCAD